MNEVIHIALAFDEAYAPHGGATIASVLANAAPEDKLKFHLLDNGISVTSRESLQKFVESQGGKIHFIKVDLRQFATFPTKHHPAAAYARLSLPELLPNLDRIIYLDSDVIVLKPLGAMWEAPLNCHAAAVVRDAADVFGSHFLDHKQRLGLRLDQAAFNSGVMLLNLAVWREKSLSAQVARWIEENSQLMIHSDQDALNAVLKDQLYFLNPIWNVQAPLIRAVQYGWIHQSEWIEAVRNPAIVHYTTGAKPWKFSFFVPRRADYRRYANLAKQGKPGAFPAVNDISRRIGAEAVEFRHWLAALVKGRLKRI